jgi:uncharacterized membrane protein YccC
VPSRDHAAELGFAEALRTRNRGIGSLSMVLRIAVATTASYLLAKAFSGSASPIFAPITTLLVVQGSPFSTLGMTAQRVLGTGLGVAAATVYVSFVPITWWSILLALVVSLLVARLLPVGIAGQLQIPLATVFVLALGPGDLRVDIWRVADVALGALVGVIAVFAAPPRPRLAEARAEQAAFVADISALLRAMAQECGAHSIPLPHDVRHAYVGLSRALRGRTVAARDAMAEAIESVRFNPRARTAGTELDSLDQQLRWLVRLSIQTRSLAGAADRLYDRDGVTPALPASTLAPLMVALADLIDAVTTAGVDDDTFELNQRLAHDLRAAVEEATSRREVVHALQSVALLGRLDQLRDIAVQGPLPEDEVDASLEDEPVADAAERPSARVRRLLGRG